MTFKSFSVLTFIVVAFAQLIAVSFEFELMADITKPFIIIALLTVYLTEVKERSALFIFALLFCWAGDVLLIFQPHGELFFIFGLVAFLIGHLLYMISYNRFRWSDISGELIWTQKLRFAFPVILFGTGLVTILFPLLGPLKIPVLLYASILTGMVITAMFRYGRTSSISFWKLFSGALLFMVSDSILALNKFYSPIPKAGLWIMLTYMLAQYLIVDGVMEHFKSEAEL